MATKTAPGPISGKRKREESHTNAAETKRPAVGPEAKVTFKDAADSSAKPSLVQRTGSAKAPARPETVFPTNAGTLASETNGSSAPAPLASTIESHDGDIHLQLVTGSYERVLHGISAKIPRKLLRTKPASDQDVEGPSTDADNAVRFSDTFLFAAHASSIRCLAISPSTESDKRYLATGSSDERINVYSISTAPSTHNHQVDLPSLASTSSTSENPRNRSLGSLIHHDRAITRLEFPAKGKLFSAAEDNTIAISRTRDWTVLSSIKAPIPKPQGRPSGDTAAPGETPAGVNDFAIHPSQKLMLSVGRGERCLRLWNLMTGKKAGVLNFDRSLLSQAGEGKYSSGEGRQVLWTAAGDAYIVGFERGAAVFGIDSRPKALITPSPITKLHQFRMVPPVGQAGSGELVAISTEDGRILFFRVDATVSADGKDKLPPCTCVAQLGGAEAGIGGRIKDFEVLTLQVEEPPAPPMLVIITASSDGAIRLWCVAGLGSVSAEGGAPQQVGSLIGTLETGSRITCLGAFVLDGKAVGSVADEAEEAETGANENSEGSENE
ncbi:Protein mak11 [Friedmanniomyces endolithicus]|uniref:Protein mak11 n=1 Tax=Rachicladosporium monterosium TaxID=1507873 RepID=A0ABR0L251_9PEZI|nr:Protein mak11 [Friedmanniomyces endolithicus]KAK1091855.1 Protein mak11 [Friedmanniomyces endolithicus]KAK5142323.1 Protein mak11 [Rachicladosporium monterosium]